MTEKKVPYLCGGVMFFLLTQTVLPNGTARDHRDGIADDHANPILMKDFIYTFTGKDVYGSDKDTSKYLNCESEGTVNLPFNNIAVVTTFDNLIKEKYPAALKRMSRFVKHHIDPDLREWLVKAILEIIENDSSISEDDLFCITSAGAFVPKKDIRKMAEFELQPFLVGVLHFILQQRREKNRLGVGTLDSFSIKKSRKPRVYNGNVGESIERKVRVSVYELPQEQNDCGTSINSDIEPEPQSDEEVIADAFKKPLRMFADALKTNTHQLAEQIRADNKKSDSSENEPETVEAEVVDDEKPSGAADEDKNITVIKQQTNVIQNGDNNVNVTNNGTMNFNF